MTMKPAAEGDVVTSKSNNAHSTRQALFEQQKHVFDSNSNSKLVLQQAKTVKKMNNHLKTNRKADHYEDGPKVMPIDLISQESKGKSLKYQSQNLFAKKHMSVSGL